MINGTSIPKWFLTIIASVLSAYFIWSVNSWIEKMDQRFLFIEKSLTNYRLDQLENYLWMASLPEFKDIDREKEIRIKIRNLRDNK